MGLLALGLIAAPVAHAQTRVRLVLDWQIQGPQAPFITAKATGAFTAQGLDVDHRSRHRLAEDDRAGGDRDL